MGASDKKLVRWVFQKYQYFKKMLNSNLTVKEFKEKFSKPEFLFQCNNKIVS